MNKQEVDRKYKHRVPRISPKDYHGDSHTRLHQIWCGMIQRVTDENHTKYHRYGGRGISVCDDWMYYVNFKNWALENGYSNELKIERVNNDGNYCPENCVWATEDVQKYNKSTTRWIEYNGDRLPLSIMADKYGIDRDLLSSRILAGWDVERAITYPNRQRGKVPFFNKKKSKPYKVRIVATNIDTGVSIEFESISSAADILKINASTLKGVLRRGEKTYNGYIWEI